MLDTIQNGNVQDELLNDGGDHLKNTHNPAYKPNTRLKESPPVTFSQLDVVFALVAFILGFLYIRWVFLAWAGYGVAVFTTLYCGAVAGYLTKKNAFHAKEGIFWFAIVWLTGMSYALTTSDSTEPWRSLFLMSTATYAIVAATKNLILDRTERYWPIDLFNAGLMIPFKNMDLQTKVIYQATKDKRQKSHVVFSVLLGVAGFVIISMVLMPLLLSADSGGFEKMTRGFDHVIQWFQEAFSFNIMNMLLAIPVGIYLYGLIVGSAKHRHTDAINPKQVNSGLETFKVVSDVTVVTLLGLVCSIYSLFIVTQLPYFFSAFAGEIPQGFKSYAHYARSGFFELCQIAVINMILILLANLLQKGEKQMRIVMRILKSMLSLVTIILIVTALSKMILYMSVYGLTVKRLMPCFLMLFLAFIFTGIIFQQIRCVAIGRAVVIVGSIAICSLSLMNLDDLVCEYNVSRYLEGSLSDFDVEVLYRAKESGVDASIRLYEMTENEALKSYVVTYLWSQKRDLTYSEGTMMNTLKEHKARKQIEAFQLKYPYLNL